MPIQARICMLFSNLCGVGPHEENENEDEVNIECIQHYVPFINPDAANPFNPSRFSEDTMKYVHSKARYSAVLLEDLLA